VFEYKCKLQRVVDGDTVDLWVDLGFSIHIKERFRLARIDAPESRTKDLEEKKRGLAATEFLKGLLKGKSLKVTTEKDKKGKFGRWIGTIYVADKYAFEHSKDWMEVNTLMVSNGHAIFKEY